MKKRQYPVLTAIGLLLCFHGVARSQGSPPNPKVILGEMIALYKGASSYQDSGVVNLLPGDPTLPASSKGFGFSGASYREEMLVSFKTYYARPRMFRFDWTSSSPRASREAVVWSDGKRAYSWTPDMANRDGSFTLFEEASLWACLEAAMRSSGGAAYHVPTLLMKDVSPDKFADYLNAMAEASLLREEMSDGESCHVIAGKIFGTPWVLWIGKRSRLLRKTRTLYVRGSFHDSLKGVGETSVAEEIHRDIRINEKIPERVFRYGPQILAGDDDLTR